MKFLKKGGWPVFRAKWWWVREHLGFRDGVQNPGVDVLISIDLDITPNPACFNQVKLHELVWHSPHGVAWRDVPADTEINSGGVFVVKNNFWGRLYLEELTEL